LAKKKALNLDVNQKRALIEPMRKDLSITKQCNLIDLNRSSLYFKPIRISTENLNLMKEIDKVYLNYPFYGSRRITVFLNTKGYRVNRKRIQKLMEIMALKAAYPKRNLSKPDSEHRKFPYLLNDFIIDYPNKVWGTDITYIPMRKGFLYLTAIIDWFSRYILSWNLSNSLDVSFCIETLKNALKKAIPYIHNSDLGSQFTSKAYLEVLEKAKVKISMDGKGRALDNVFIERFWKSLKYEEVYLNEYKNGLEVYENVKNYINFYNYERPHQSLKYKTPYEIYKN